LLEDVIFNLLTWIRYGIFNMKKGSPFSGFGLAHKRRLCSKTTITEFGMKFPHKMDLI